MKLVCLLDVAFWFFAISSSRARAFTVQQNNNHYNKKQSTILLHESASTSSFEGTVVVCTGPTCTKNGGGKKVVKLLQELIDQTGAKIDIDTINCVSECAECGLGPNCELRAKGDDGPFYPIKNNIKTQNDLERMLGLTTVASATDVEEK